MRAFKVIGAIILIIFAIFLVVGLFLPSKVHVEESITINKSANVIFKQINNFQNWSAWSPWEAKDPGMLKEFDGPRLGVGSKYSWQSKSQGNGSMTIIESVPYTSVVCELDFMEEGKASTAFRFEESDGGTVVTWTMDIPDLPYPMGRYFGVIMPGSISEDFVAGLDKLKQITEGMPDSPVLQLTQMDEMMAVTVVDSCSWSEIGDKMAQMFGELMATVVADRKVEMAGPPFTMYHKWDEVNQFAVFENGLPVSAEPKVRGRVQFKVIPSTMALMGVHYGPYENTEYLYLAMDEWLAEFNLEMSGGPVEVYITDPSSEPDTAKWQTNVYFPIK